MEEMIDYILKFGSITPQQIDLIKSKAEVIHLKKGTYFSEANKLAKQVGFITEGIIRVCYYGNKGEEYTRCFVLENRFVVDSSSFFNDTPSSEYVEAVTDCTLLVFSKSAFTELSNIVKNWSDIFTRILTDALMKKVQASNTLLNQDATTRYTKFLELFPNVANQVPLSMLASYLGITQSSLSRIRKNIS
ncbi:Crp/Fnr family transcriptional regulator [Pedobacter lithocola]|uniref:Crp/Fnr family transcriptional regulator n=1 Tax=Pedobacter lithocola TaxID=1908239 RepID=A0ABV8P5J3_9SPHI